MTTTVPRSGDVTANNADLFAMMNRAQRILDVLRSYPVSTTLDDHIAYAHALADLGVHVVVLKPGVKNPDVDFRTKQERDADKAAGRRGGVYLGTTDKQTLTVYITRCWEWYGVLPNFGVWLGPSRLIAVDADNEGDVIEWLTAADLRGEPQTVTVLTPGAINPDGTWRHKDGAHVYYTVPAWVDPYSLMDVSESNVPADAGRGGWDVKTGDTLVVIPPSIRKEGQYRLHHSAQLIEAPATLLAMIERPERVARDFDDDDEDAAEFRESVEDAMRDVPWSEVLEGTAYPDGIETCGCEIWTRYGGSRKSFVAHTDCPTLGGRTCLVVHSDNVPNHDIFVELARDRGGKAFSKWEALAVLHFDGDMGAVAREYGFASSRGGHVVFGENPFAMSVERGASAAMVSPAQSGTHPQAGTYNPFAALSVQASTETKAEDQPNPFAKLAQQVTTPTVPTAPPTEPRKVLSGYDGTTDPDWSVICPHGLTLFKCLPCATEVTAIRREVLLKGAVK